MPSLAEMIGREPDQRVSLRQGVVSAAPGTGGTLEVRLAGSATAVPGVRRLQSSAVNVNDVVWVLQQGMDLLVLGKVSTASYGGADLSPGLELYHPSSTPFIDFHRGANAAGDSSADYNVRLINEADGRLTLKAPDAAGTGLMIDGAWLRIKGSRGLFFEDWGGGWFMQDATWVRAYGNKAVFADQEIKTGAGNFNARDLAGMGQGYHGGYAWFGHWAYRNSALHYGFLHNGGEALVSGDAIFLRYQNANRFLVNVNGSTLYGPLALLDNYVYTRAWNDGWHLWHWWSGNDGLRWTEYGGLYFRVRDQDPALEIFATGQTQAQRFDQIGAYDTSALRIRSAGGGSGCKLGYWSAGQNAAHIHKCWGSSIEVRTWDDVGWGYSVGDFNDVCTMRAKVAKSVETLGDKLPKAERKAKLKRLRAVKYQRPLEDACVNCLATGLKAQNQRFMEKERAAMVAAGLFGADMEPCPDCQGTKKKKPDQGAQKNHDTGYFGFVAEEVAAEFPEAIWFDTDGLPTAMKPAALIAVLWEEVKDLEERLALAEGKIK